MNITLEQATEISLIVAMVCVTVKACHYPIGKFLRWINPFDIGIRIQNLKVRITELEMSNFQLQQELKDLLKKVNKKK